jgi:transglutaminase-like putative cysteine protease
MDEYLRATTVINWSHPTILELAKAIAATRQTPVAIAQACFEWVRDQVHHSVDYQMNPVTCTASQVLQHRTGYCFAKSHLLAALLRANGIPAGFCYQRLSLDDFGDPYSLHGFNALYLPEVGWYRVDARGNRLGINAQFILPDEQLAYQVCLPGEMDFPVILAEPLPIVVQALQQHQCWDEMLTHLPDVVPTAWKEIGLLG